MNSIILIAIVIIAILLVAVALLVWRRQKGEKPEIVVSGRKKAFFAQWIAGIVVAFTAAALMIDGHILGENTTGIATVIGIIGISLIATSNINLLPARRK